MLQNCFDRVVSHLIRLDTDYMVTVLVGLLLQVVIIDWILCEAGEKS